MLRPYFACIQSIFEQMHQFDAQAGRRFLIKRPWILEDMVGTDGMRTLTQTKYSDIEQFRFKASLTLNPQELKAIADQMILQQGGLLDRQLLDAVSAGRLLGNSYPEDLWPAVELYTEEAAIAREKQAQDQAKVAQMGMLQQREQQLMDQERDMYDRAMDITTKADQTNMKGNMPALQAQAKMMTPEPVMA